VVEHGAAHIGIVTLDAQRLGASEQTRCIGRLLGIETLAVEEPQVLATLAARWAHKRLILIDTAGIAPRDTPAIDALRQLLGGVGERHTLLVLPASAQPELLDSCLERFAPLAPQAVVLTRVDEALSLGGALAALLRHRLPIAAVSNGPRVPEDLRPARSADLVAAAVGLKAEKNVRRDVEHAAA
jgi:flagellar biosynthesis protein FlhF